MFSLNMQSGMLHLEDHGGGTNAESFDRADAADKAMHDAGKKMAFCKQCFPDNRNSIMEDRMAQMEADNTPADAKADRMATGSPTENTAPRGTMPPRVTDPTADGRA
jgi:hypothetical protein